MIVGHALLAFGLAMWVGRRWDANPRGIAVVAAGFALVPDVDIAFAVLGIIQAATGAPPLDAFWSAGLVVHRDVTHSLLVGGVAAVAFAWSVEPTRDRRVVAGLALSALVGLVAWHSGVIAGIATLLYAVAGVTVALCARRIDIGGASLLHAALIGLLTHPFGDLFTGTPPQLVYPVPISIVTDRVVLVGDPTLNLLATFGLEVGAAWIAVIALLSHRRERIRDTIEWPAVGGVGAVPLVEAVPRPTLAEPYGFAAGMLLIGVSASAAGCFVGGLREGDSRLAEGRLVTAFVTGLSAVTVGLIGYGVAYTTL